MIKLSTQIKAVNWFFAALVLAGGYGAFKGLFSLGLFIIICTLAAVIINLNNVALNNLNTTMKLNLIEEKIDYIYFVIKKKRK